MEETKTIYTIGHSNRSFEQFIAMLQSFNISMIADIRSLPGSRKYPHFDKESLEVSMPANGIEYMHLLSLGGRRRANKNTRNTAWRHLAFRGYADYMETPAFVDGIKELTIAAKQFATVYICSEAVWWRCHRAMVSDYLKLQGWRVMHIMSEGKATEHPCTSAATIINGELSYHEKDDATS
jgi:uncharacterized protein (DUF488 family)